MSLRIDAHQHYWAPARGDYGWLTPDLGLLFRDYGPTDLAPDLKRHGIDGTVLVQAAPSLAETRYMLDIARETPSVLGVVGWFDFADSASLHAAQALCEDPLLVGFRPMIQDNADENWMLRDDLGAAFRFLIDRGLTFDALTLPRHLRNLLALAERHPDLAIVIDHGSKPRIAERGFDDWAADMRRLARNSSALVKLSGLVTEASADWSGADLAPYVDLLLDAFGPQRVMFGSDWPVCLQASGYARWIETAEGFIAHLTDFERAAIMGANAQRFYGLSPRKS